MRRYWDRLEQLTRTIARETDPKDRMWFHEQVPHYYSEELLGELEAILAEARAAAAGQAANLKRIEVAQVGIDYARVQRGALAAVAAYNKDPKQLDAVIAVLQRKQAFFREHASDWTIGLNHIYWREARSTRHAMRYGTLVGDAYLHPRKLAELVNWQFATSPDNKGEQNGWQQPDFDDTAWKQISAMTFWEQQGYKDYDGYGWYRRKLTVPEDWRKHKKIILRFGAVDESFWLYIDGKLVREWLYEPAKDARLWTKPRPVDITDRVRFGAEHTLAVKVHDSGGAGGFWKSVLVVDGE